MDFSKVQGLLNLLDDPDEQIYNQISEEIKSLGPEVMPYLENFWEESADELAISRAQHLIDSIGSSVCLSQLKTWVELGGENLLKGASLVAKCQYPNLDEKKLLAEIEKIRQDIWIELNDQLTGIEKIAIVNRILFDFHGYEGNREDYYSPKNSFLNKVIDQKAGTPLSIGVLYIILCQSLDIPVVGVNLPHHFILAYKDDDAFPIMNEEIAEPGILFYINPFNKGSLFGKPEVKDFLHQNKVDPKPEFFQPCSSKEIIKRMINNIIVAYQKEEKTDIANKFLELLKVFN